MVSHHKKIYISVFIILVALLAVLQIPSVTVQLKAFHVTTNLLVPDGGWRPLEVLTKKPTQEERAIKSLSGRGLNVRLYLPASAAEEPISVMVIYTPFIGGGPDDSRLTNLAETFARAGFVVAVPWREEERLVASPQDIEDIISTVLFLKEKPDLRIKKLGLLGISYGSGPVIVAAADDKLRESIDFVVSFSGYYDLESALQFIIDGKSSPYAREILDTTLKYHNTDEETFAAGEEFAELRKMLSPSSVVDNLAAEFFIVHSLDDPYIPYSESERLSRALKDRVPTTLTLLGFLEHGTYKRPTLENIRRSYLPSTVDFYKMIHGLLANYL